MSKPGSPLIVANWKMNPETLREAKVLLAAVRRRAARLKHTRVVVCPPAVFLQSLATSQSNQLGFGGQDCFWDTSGPYTGATSPTMLYYTGARYVILGHSERRFLGETDEMIRRKVRAALGAGLKVILCVGERERDTEGRYLQEIERQLTGALTGLSRPWAKGLVVAYEPLWAIGLKALGADTPAGFLEQAIYIKKVVSKIFGKDAALSLPVLYGGSVDAKNAARFIAEGEAAGLLVGRASLDAAGFSKLLDAVEKSYAAQSSPRA